MSRIKAQPCNMGEASTRNNPANREMALAFALHDYSQQLLLFSQPATLENSPMAFKEWLRTVKQTISFYEDQTK